MCSSQQAGGDGTSHATVAVAALGAFLFAFAWRILAFSGFPNDHYVNLARAHQMFLGDWPVRDFVDPGMPLMYAASAAARLIGGDGMLPELVLVAGAFGLGAALTLPAAVRLSGSLTLALLVTLLEIAMFPRTYSYPKILLYAVAGCGIVVVARRPSSRRVRLGVAALIAASFLFRHDHGLYIAVASAAALALGSRAEGWQTAIRRSARLAAVALILLLPWGIFVTMNGGLVSYFRSAIRFSRAEATASKLPAPAFRLSPSEGLIRIAPPEREVAQTKTSETGEGGGSWWRHALAVVSPARVQAASGLHIDENASAWVFYLFWTLPALCGALAWRRRGTMAERWTGESAAVMALALLALVVDAGFLRSPLKTRLPDAIVPQVLLGAWGLGVVWLRASPRRWLPRVSLLRSTEAQRPRAQISQEFLGASVPRCLGVPSR